ncbi:transaldolase family protein [Christensenella tenuis]|jgi:transaldolase|uniref:Transaldolase n=1 Tax=Christensenella tenuis TaxID=2763033 RepID=A0ABR7EFQ2_9FIRM|nr:transaldolase family protein [Christensenella tenuis]MBC5648216.1 hypothetical protein [Christensenella tenuis]
MSMYENWIALRNELIFEATPCNFERRCEAVLARYGARFAQASAAEKEEIAQLLADAAADLMSYLPNWTLRAKTQKDPVSGETLKRQADAFLAAVRSCGYEDKAAAAEREIASFANSKLIRLTELAAEGVIHNYWGNDNGIGIMEAMRRGAALVTTNPPIVNMAREACPDVFDKVRDAIKERHPNDPAQRKISYLTMDVVLNNARALRPIYRLSGAKLGYVNYQVSPKNYKDAGKMVEEVEFAYETMGKALGGKPNVVFKVPGTFAALDAVKRLTAEGIGVNITVNFSVPQCIAFAQTIESGRADLSYMTVMAGRLDGPVGEELEKAGVPDAGELARLASRLVTQRVYRDVILKNGYRHVEILVASLRGAWNFDASITDHGESKIVISSFPDKAEEYDGEPLQVSPMVDVPVAEEKLAQLRKSGIFVKAYEPDAMEPEEFDDYIPVQLTLGSFIDVYGKLEEYVK